MANLRQHISSLQDVSGSCTYACEWCAVHVYDVACLLVVDSNAATSQRMGSCATSTRTIQGSAVANIYHMNVLIDKVTSDLI